MSLLMEALRKAEAAKRQVQEEQALIAAAVPDAPVPPSESPAPDLRERVLTLEERDVLQRASEQELQEYLNHPHDPDEFPSRIPTLTSAVSEMAASLDRQAAATVFSAKAVRVKEGMARRTRTAVLAAIAIMLVPVWFAVAWYLEQQNGSSLELDPTLANVDLRERGFLGEDPAPVAGSPPAAPVAAAAPSPATAATPQPTTTFIAPAAQDQLAAAGDSSPALPTDTIRTEAVLPSAATAIAFAADDDAPTNSPAAVPALTLEIKRSSVSSSVDPQLQEAYSLFRAGNLDDATQRYQAVVEKSPDNRDALLGLGAIALQKQQPAEARSYYSRLLALNPQDHLARTGLMQSLGSLGPAERETTLRNMLSDAAGSSPAVAPLHFAMGNLYAQQQRWQDAQAAYFNALLQARRTTSEPVNPDYAFNLAISLERLGQGKAAVEYYKEAQNLARITRGSFDTALLNQRLATLEQTPP